MKLHTPIEYLKGVGPKKGELLRKELGIAEVRDLINYFPFRYIDRSRIYKLAELTEDMSLVQCMGRLGQFKLQGGGRRKRLTAELTDDTGSMELVWFQGARWVSQSLKPGQVYLVFGRPGKFGRKMSMAHPEMELMTRPENLKKRSGLRPVYSSTEKLKKAGLETRHLEKLMKQMLEQLTERIPEILPQDYLDQLKLVDRQLAFYQVHFPCDQAAMQHARRRLKFDELLLVQLQILSNANQTHKERKGYLLDQVGEMFNRFYDEKLPFKLTGAQKRVVKEIHRDMRSGIQMNRLLQGDVGSGKTVVALLSILLAIDNGKQAALMAPTEILARQHYQGISDMLYGLPVGVEVLTGSSSKADRQRIHDGLRNGSVHLLIGTHALIEDQVMFDRLGLVIIDEQHRFGVAQRARLWEKGKELPHVLVMTATPIPRTLAMTLYGDLDTSVLDELPPGRKEIVTRHSYEKDRLQIFGFLKKQIAEGRQVYIVYPLIEESAKLDLQNLMEGYESIQRAFPAPDYKISIVHGRMKAEDKQKEMMRFKAGQTHIMVATTVIEVGVDVPNASVMVIENADRFGLSQLHQLRGRVGRGASQSYCVLISGHKLSNDARRRLECMVQTNDGFKIAEVDLEIRGPGDLTGTQQSGLPAFKIANLVTDYKELKLARYLAMEILKSDPRLEEERHRGLNISLRKLRENQLDWSLIS